MSFVYFITCPPDEYVKIGWAKNPQSRVRALEIGNPHGLNLRFYFYGFRSDEALLHRAFDEYCTSPEWFDNTETLRELVLRFWSRFGVEISRKDFSRTLLELTGYELPYYDIERLKQ